MTPKGAICWLSAITGSLLIGLWGRRENLGVMTADDSSHIVSATIATFYVAPVEEFSVAVLFRKMFIQELKEPLGNVSGHTLVVWWIEPDDIALAIAAWY